MNTEAVIDDFARITDGSTLVIQRWLPGPIERLWRYLTDGEQRRKWLASGDMALVPGAGFELVWQNDDLSGGAADRPAGFAEVQRMDSRVIAVDPMRLLTIAWGKGDVSFELVEQGERVLLTITHRGLDDPSARSMIAAGWHQHLDILVALAGKQTPPSFWPGWRNLQKIYDSRL